METLELIERGTEELKARLEADEYFVDVAVVRADDGLALAEMRRRQGTLTTKGGKRGVAVVVLPVEANDEQPNITFGPMTLRLGFQVVENVELNRDPQGTGKSSLQVARRVKDVIKSAIFEGVLIDIKPSNPCIESIDLANDLGKAIKAHEVSFTCLEANPRSARQVALPVLALAEGGVATLTCGTDGATIYYTLNGEYPAAGRNGAAVYGAPIAIPEDGMTVRACAYKTGMIASVVINRTVERVG